MGARCSREAVFPVLKSSQLLRQVALTCTRTTVTVLRAPVFVCLASAAGPPRGPGAAGAAGLPALASPPGRAAELPGAAAGVEVTPRDPSPSPLFLCSTSPPLPPASFPAARWALRQVCCVSFIIKLAQVTPPPKDRLLRCKSSGAGFGSAPSDVFLVSLLRKN